MIKVSNAMALAVLVLTQLVHVASADAADGKFAFCPGETNLMGHQRIFVHSLFWPDTGLDRVSKPRLPEGRTRLRAIAIDDNDRPPIENWALHQLTVNSSAPRVTVDHIRPADIDEAASFSSRDGSEDVETDWDLFFVREEAVDRAQIAALIERGRADKGALSEDVVGFEHCKITRSRIDNEIVSTTAILGDDSTSEQDLHCAMSAVLFHYGHSNYDYIAEDNIDYIKRGKFAAPRGGFQIFDQLYPLDGTSPEVAPGASRCELVSSLLDYNAGQPAKLFCPQNISVHNPRKTHDWRGVSLTREYWFNPLGVWFKVPFAYLTNWPSRLSEPLLRQRTPDNPSPPGTTPPPFLRFSFWMPDLRWPEHNRFNVPSFRPCEDGRQPPGEDEYVVQATLEWPWLPDPEANGFILPSTKLANGQKVGTNILDPEAEAPEGLIRLRLSHTERPAFYTKPGVSPQGIFNCTINLVNHGCSGDFWWPEENLGMHLFFPYANIDEWQIIADNARTLLKRWHVSSLNK